MQFNKLKRHEFITLRGGAAPIIQSARNQQQHYPETTGIRSRTER